MESIQKYIAGKRVRKVILSQDFFDKLEGEGDAILRHVMRHLEAMKNDIQGYTQLAFAFNGDETPRFVVFKFVELNEKEIKLYEYEDISSDRYLDMLLEDNVLLTEASQLINY